MNYCKYVTNLIVWVSILFFIFSPNAQAAYLDPGSGSFIIQMIIASLVGASFFIKTFWRNIKAFFATRFSTQSKDNNNDE